MSMNIDEKMKSIGFKCFTSSNGDTCYTKMLDKGISLTTGKYLEDGNENGYVAVIIHDDDIGKENFFKEMLVGSFKDIDDLVENYMNMNRYKKNA